MSRTNRVPRDLADAAAVHAAREEIVQALGPLAASPLDEEATAGMRAALERAESPAVRRAIRRLTRMGQSRPPLMAVPHPAEEAEMARPQAPPSDRRPHQFIPAFVGGAA